ncbi:hypothetical protein RDI58_020306 [Solanum bulbocastanum]|uniref:DEAD/DEAH-box helicase domain-containing protein n=1 Tax=Solanum bulbocastanum TaxID=147425 RepID=A0AAN8T6D3_SOLBU
MEGEIERLRNENQRLIEERTVSQCQLGTARKELHPDHIKMVVLDKADEMLSIGFDVQIHKILSLLPAKVEVVAFYATMPKDALGLTRKKFMNKPKTTTN